MRTRRRNFLFVQWYPRALFAAGEAGVLYLPHPSTTWQDSARTTPGAIDFPVGAIDDLSGNNNHALQATAGKRPILRQTAGGHWYLEGDGVDDFLRASFVYTQPYERISAFRAVGATVNNHYLGGVSAGAGIMFRNGSSGISINSGASVNGEAWTLGVDIIITERHDGANSRVSINNNAYSTGNAGTAVGGGVTLLGASDDNVEASSRLYGTVIGSFGSLSDDSIQLARDFMARRAGIVS